MMRIHFKNVGAPIILQVASFMYRRIRLSSLWIILTFLLSILFISSLWDSTISPLHNNSNVLWLWKEADFSSLNSLWSQPILSQHLINKTFVLNKSLGISNTPSHLQSITSISNLRQYISSLNSDQFVQNEDIYGHLPTKDNFNHIKSAPEHVILIQVHNRTLELTLLIESLRRVKGIEKALVIFSHDFYSDEMNNLIASIRFTRTVQIFYPHSTQIFPNSFPGTDPRDCESRLSPDKAKIIGCLNADWPDTYKHYRESRFTQIKNHWLWKIQFILEHFYPTKYYNGYFILLEEDHFVLEDILHVTSLISTKFQNPVNTDEIIALGSYDKDQTYTSGKAEITYWLAPKHNMGIAISRSVWEKIKSCEKIFCTYDDYNWDWTLQYVGQHCFPNKLKVLTLPGSTRVFHLGECRGLHHENKVCSSELLATNILQKFSGSLLTKLYPTSLYLTRSVSRVIPTQRANGGWSDLRDRNLCYSLLSAKWNDFLKQWAPTLTNYSPIY
uniref:Alpha-1,6-mannosyl-glycoprotein 2-beta-N-acetylglucosaminyltransferase n=1 Tax=Trichobilharzia regenti TaxID=157069 RepID=A0AA85IQ30_TRIRE|nr:unnamed protein product [Trichobilharzia regenti]